MVQESDARCSLETSSDCGVRRPQSRMGSRLELLPYCCVVRHSCAALCGADFTVAEKRRRAPFAPQFFYLNKTINRLQSVNGTSFWAYQYLLRTSLRRARWTYRRAGRPLLTRHQEGAITSISPQVERRGIAHSSERKRLEPQRSTTMRASRC